MDEITCPDCNATFLENQLRMEQVTKESCPGCGVLLREAESWGSTNVQLITATDIQAIDTWLDNYNQTTGKKVVQRVIDDHKRQRLWSIETEYPFACEVNYEMKQPEIVAVCFVSERNFEQVFTDCNRLRLLAARHGLEAVGYRQSENDWTGATVSGKWGVKQKISVHALCENWFTPLFTRLNAAMAEASETIAGV